MVKLNSHRIHIVCKTKDSCVTLTYVVIHMTSAHVAHQWLFGQSGGSCSRTFQKITCEGHTDQTLNQINQIEGD